MNDLAFIVGLVAALAYYFWWRRTKTGEQKSREREGDGNDKRS
ncbi:MAG: hypothetical protein N3A57_05285 [Negativicutes bacterium]|nr:hypothetical protein [Negativicutes bacterium]